MDCVVIVSDRALDELRESEICEGVYAVASATPSTARPRSVLGVGGCGRLGRRLIADIGDASQELLSRNSETWSDLGQSLYGSVCLYLWDSTRRELAILPDPLGSAIVFTYSGHNLKCYSTDIGMLVRTLSRVGISLKKSAAYAAGLVITGSGGAVAASYDGVEVLEMGEYVVIDPAGPRELMYSRMMTLGSQTDYDALQDEAARDIRANVEAAVRSDYDLKISHLTGGYDSRLVLAGIREQVKEHAFFYHCLKTPRVDRDVAEGLARTFGLTMTEYSGVDSTKAFETQDDVILAPYRFSDGMFINGPRVGHVGASTLVLQGGYGGLARSFMKRNLADIVLDPDPTLFANAYWGGYGFDATDSDSLFSQEFQRSLADQARRVILRGADRGIRSDALTDYYFLSTRNRYWIAMQSVLRSRVIAQFDPLYTVAIPSSALSLDFASRRANIVALDLMEKLDPILLSYPFAYDTPFNWEYQQLRALPQMRAFDERRSLAVLPASNVRRTPAALPSGARLPKPTPEQAARAHALRQPDSRIVRYDYSLSRLDAVLEEVEARVPEMAEIINKGAVQRLLSEEPRSGGEIQAVNTLYGALLWLMD